MNIQQTDMRVIREKLWDAAKLLHRPGGLHGAIGEQQVRECQGRALEVAEMLRSLLTQEARIMALIDGIHVYSVTRKEERIVLLVRTPPAHVSLEIHSQEDADEWIKTLRHEALVIERRITDAARFAFARPEAVTDGN